MSLQDLAALGSFVSGVAVLVSLLFLYYQLRQISTQIRIAEKNQRASIRAERTSRTLSNFQAFLEPTASEAMFKGMAGAEDLTSTQIQQFSLYCLSRFHNLEDAFAQHADGLLDETAFANMRATLRAAFRAPGLRAGWRMMRNLFDADGPFVAFVDGELAATPVSIGPEVAEGWKAAFVAEKRQAAAAVASPDARPA